MINFTETISYDDICLVPAYSDLDSRSEASLLVDYNYSSPIVNAPMVHTSNGNMLKFMLDNNLLTTVHRYFKSADDQIMHVKNAVGDEFTNVFFAVGRTINWIYHLHTSGVTNYCVDMAHGDSKICIETIKYIKHLNPNALVMAGNVATEDGYVRLVNAGAELVRVGIAGGSICSTAKNTAFGVPMITSIMECKTGQDKVGGILIADGGIRSASDMLKAIAVGADLCMCGGLLASTSEAKGPFFNKNFVDVNKLDPTGFNDYIMDIRYVEYGGMASHEMRMYNSSHVADSHTSIEGVFGKVNYTGITQTVLNNINANLKAGLSYCGSHNWEEFKEKVVIIRMSTAGIIEKETHLAFSG